MYLNCSLLFFIIYLFFYTCAVFCSFSFSTLSAGELAGTALLVQLWPYLYTVCLSLREGFHVSHLEVLQLTGISGFSAEGF